MFNKEFVHDDAKCWVTKINPVGYYCYILN